MAVPSQKKRSPSDAPILITGAGGSIGSALALHLATTVVPLFLLDSSASRLAELRTRFVEVQPDAHFVLGDVGDAKLLDRVLAGCLPHVIFHCAAHKHVPHLEGEVLAAIENNIFAAEQVARFAQACGARLIFLSTDKVVEPASVLGATKWVAEQLVLMHGGTAVRLVNVLGSSGSVAEIFARQIDAGDPITLTGRDARRYFITIDEAVGLLLGADNVPTTAVYVPHLQADSSVADLAAFLVEQLACGRTIPIEISELRPGDKWVEKLWASDESVGPEAFPGLLTISRRPTDIDTLQSGMAKLRDACRNADQAAALDTLCAMVPAYRPSETSRRLASQHAFGVSR